MTRQGYTFDPSGNTTFPDRNCTEAICNPTISTSNNRLSSTGYSSDISGNTTEDAQGRIFIYDAENKQIEVRDSQQNIIGQYRY
ncbi:hypothetical protein [Leptolyngbya sp. 7M]|uniref:hypothetical protein n=1 Tax=Leptolyngbya sp. 7M TaxID=2812896 RepID=UPI001B8BD12E|nr:hypothetical protein [Leptolyngbya sp. 7M]QYO67998.1 hypothetical protein JVX88_15220 [Leptolyngbya sp. 7M]